jgi:hypothetical protein
MPSRAVVGGRGEAGISNEGVFNGESVRIKPLFCNSFRTIYMRRRLCLFPSDPCRPQNCPVNDPLSDAQSQKRSTTTWVLNGVCGSGK